MAATTQIRMMPTLSPTPPPTCPGTGCTTQHPDAAPLYHLRACAPLCHSNQCMLHVLIRKRHPECEGKEQPLHRQLLPSFSLRSDGEGNGGRRGEQRWRARVPSSTPRRHLEVTQEGLEGTNVFLSRTNPLKMKSFGGSEIFEVTKANNLHRERNNWRLLY